MSSADGRLKRGRRKRSLKDANIQCCDQDDNRKKQKLNHNTTKQKENKSVSHLVDLCDECVDCMQMIMKFLLPKERIQCFALCAQIKMCLSTFVWNDVRLSIKHASSINNCDGFNLPNLREENTNDLLKLRLIHSECSYPKSYANCIEVCVDEKYDLQNIISNQWIFKCIPNMEIFGSNTDFYDKQCSINPSDHILLNHTKYLSFDCFHHGSLFVFPSLINIFPNICCLSIMNLGNSREKFHPFDDLFAKLSQFPSLKHLQFYDCTAQCFQNVVTPFSITRIYHSLSEIVSLDISFCSFDEVVDIQNILDQFSELKYLSFICNSVEMHSLSMKTNTKHKLKIPETVVFIKYCGETLNQNCERIDLDLSKLRKSLSLMFVDCCINDFSFLDEVSNYCSDSIQYISLNYNRECHKFLERYWDKLKPYKDMIAKLQIAVHLMEGIMMSKVQTQKLKHFLMKTFSYEIDSVLTRYTLYRRYFGCVVSHIQDMEKIHQATDFFEW